MKIHALLVFYDESPSWLAATVASCSKFADHIVAVDGVYSLFPGAGAKPRSSIEQLDAIMSTAYGTGMALTLHQPTEPWWNNEVEKRTASLKLAAATGAVFDDWVVVVDADLVCTHASPHFRKSLEDTDMFAAEYGFWWDDDVFAEDQAARYARLADYNPKVGKSHVRGIYRLVPNMRYDRAHYVVKGEDEEGTEFYIWGQPDLHTPYAAAANLRDELIFEHRHAFRDKARRTRAQLYYERRGAQGAENLHDVYVEGVDGEALRVA